MVDFINVHSAGTHKHTGCWEARIFQFGVIYTISQFVGEQPARLANLSPSCLPAKAGTTLQQIKEAAKSFALVAAVELDKSRLAVPVRKTQEIISLLDCLENGSQSDFVILSCENSQKTNIWQRFWSCSQIGRHAQH